jgi:hypothetical protein
LEAKRKKRRSRLIDAVPALGDEHVEVLMFVEPFLDERIVTQSSRRDVLVEHAIEVSNVLVKRFG